MSRKLGIYKVKVKDESLSDRADRLTVIQWSGTVVFLGSEETTDDSYIEEWLELILETPHHAIDRFDKDVFEG